MTSGEPPGFLQPGGEMAELIRRHDWSATPLGPLEQWSPALRMIVPFMLANRFPMLLCWGPQYIQLYNDHYIPILGAKHEMGALGAPYAECWREVYAVLQPLIDTPFHGGPSTWTEDLEIIASRHGYPEEAHFTVAYSAVPDESAPRGIGGVLATVHETTGKVIPERRVKVLGDLGAAVAGTASEEEICARTMAVLARNPKDVPFALLYLFDADTRELRRAGATGVPDESLGPESFPEGTTLADSAWPLALAFDTETTQVRGGLSALLPRVPPGPWAVAPDALAVVPIKSHGAGRAAGALVVGLSPVIAVDTAYMTFLDLLGAQVATAVASARAYAAERRRAELLAELDRAKTAFFSNISHEFRTPLTLMLGPLRDSLATGDLAQPLRANLEIAMRNAERLLKLVNSMLDFARVEAGRAEASFEPVDLAALTADIASSFRAATERAGLTFDVACDDLGDTVYVDRDMWEKIVLNLLSNAFKFTLEGGIAVQVSREDECAVVTVSDTGVGVPEAELPRLFERFHRVEGSASRTHEGSGIGLALVQELVRMHGGTIDAASEVGVGTQFRLRLPFGSAHLPADKIRNGTTLAPTRSGAQVYVQEVLRWLPATQDPEGVVLERNNDSARDKRFASTFGARIVLADDNADMRHYVRELLSGAYRVEAVADGVEALAAARREIPDLVLCDVMMPNLDGFGLLKALRVEPALAEVPVVMLSARAGDEARIEGFERGADDYVVKPFHARELLARVGALLELTTLRRVALASRNEQLQDADRQKNEFMAMLAHELRNPLAPIRNASVLLARAVRGDANARSIVEVVQRQVGHLSRLVDDLFDISRITQKRIELDRETVSVADLVRYAIETVEPLVFERNQYLHVQTSNETMYVNGDVSRLVQCLVNLLNNAAKYTEPGGRIAITTRAEDGHAVIEVADDGMGIAPELLPRIFELFMQADRTRSRSQGGLGIGLAVVQRLVEMHAGRVVAESDGAGKGAKFAIWLPLTAPPKSKDKDAGTFCVRPQRILIVDDNVDAADTLGILLGHDGHEIDTAYNAAEALARIESFRPDTLFIDIGLPDMTGDEVVRRIRASGSAMPTKIVALTGYGRPGDHAPGEGFHARLVKPVTPEDLRRILIDAPA
ncbi:MAG: ATP-binding protein [Gammaproteobacteria bacterium]